MHFQVSHVTTYQYSRPIRLGEHWLRLRPRGDGGVELRGHDFDIQPAPQARADILDVEGNLVTRIRFQGETDRLTIASRFEAVTTRADSHDPTLEKMPWDRLYPPELRRRLAPWIARTAVAPAVRALAEELRAASSDGIEFIDRLNKALHQRIHGVIRDTGQALAPGETLRRGQGACRDRARLFIAICRAQGIAARFVSGYQKGQATRDIRYMHAWPEVYLPGSGWHGFDPAHGQRVTDQHVAVAAAARPEDAAPIEGSFFGDARSEMKAEVRIHVDG